LKKIIINSSAYPLCKPVNSIKRISRFLALFSKILVDKKILPKLIKSEDLEQVIKNNFSLVWKLYYEMQIPMNIG